MSSTPLAVAIPVEDVKLVKAPNTAKKVVFDLDTFSKKTVEVEYSYPQFTVAGVATLSPEEIVSYVNAGAKRSALLAAKGSIAGISASAVSKFLASFKMFPAFAIENFNSRKEQNDAILGFLTAPSQSVMLEFVKTQLSAAPVGNDDDEDED
jgi:hypothetical protein